jgi:hypothetical protein
MTTVYDNKSKTQVSVLKKLKGLQANLQIVHNLDKLFLNHYYHEKYEIANSNEEFDTAHIDVQVYNQHVHVVRRKRHSYRDLSKTNNSKCFL